MVLAYTQQLSCQHYDALLQQNAHLLQHNAQQHGTVGGTKQEM